MANPNVVTANLSCSECTITVHSRQCKGDVLIFPYGLDLSWVIAFQPLDDWFDFGGDNLLSRLAGIRSGLEARGVLCGWSSGRARCLVRIGSGLSTG